MKKSISFIILCMAVLLPVCMYSSLNQKQATGYKFIQQLPEGLREKSTPSETPRYVGKLKSKLLTPRGTNIQKIYIPYFYDGTIQYIFMKKKNQLKKMNLLCL